LLVEINQHSNYYQEMSYSFEYIDIILLAMIAGFIFLRLRGILGKRTGFEGKSPAQFKEVLKNIKVDQATKPKEKFDDEAQKEFLKGAKIAYETIITDFSDNDNKLTDSKPLLSKKIFDQFNQALQERSKRGHYAEITFIGVNSAVIKEHKNIDEILKVTVDFVSEVITCIKDKNKNIISGDPKKIKKIHDTWVFSRDTRSNNPNWQLVDILT
jgi:predicted lipid-binding transport protein (Tim44 family)